MSYDSHFEPARRTLQVTPFENPCCRHGVKEESQSPGWVKSGTAALCTGGGRGLLGERKAGKNGGNPRQRRGRGLFIRKCAAWAQLSGHLKHDSCGCHRHTFCQKMSWCVTFGLLCLDLGTAVICVSSIILAYLLLV